MASGASSSNLALGNAPIVEAVLDIECDLPIGAEIRGLEERARAALSPQYPTVRMQMLHEHQIAQEGGTTNVSSRHDVQALQFLTADEKQIVQLRRLGFSFNRLAPYATLDAYLQEIRRTWDLYRGIAAPLQVRIVRLRYINSLPLPLRDGAIDFAEFLAVHPRIGEPEGLSLTGFFNQNVGVEVSSGSEFAIVLATQPVAASVQPVIFDITVGHSLPLEPDDWSALEARIQSLRGLKNRVFQSTLTPRCLSLFQ
jgi:uncharacterized protein (TIGR04255 family)